MNTAALVLLVAAASASILGTIRLLHGLRTAPVGFEDAEGFHATAASTAPTAPAMSGTAFGHASA